MLYLCFPKKYFSFNFGEKIRISMMVNGNWRLALIWQGAERKVGESGSFRIRILKGATLLGGNGEPGLKCYCPGEVGNLGLHVKSPEFLISEINFNFVKH